VHRGRKLKSGKWVGQKKKVWNPQLYPLIDTILTAMGVPQATTGYSSSNSGKSTELSSQNVPTTHSNSRALLYPMMNWSGILSCNWGVIQMMLIWSLNSERRQNDTTSFKLQINLVPCSVAWKVIELYFNFPYLGLFTWQERKYHLSTLWCNGLHAQCT